MPSSDRGPLDAAKHLAWTLLLVAVLLWAAVWIISKIWVWLVVIAVLSGIVTVLLWWRQSRRDRW